jgi:hypothetical protein
VYCSSYCQFFFILEGGVRTGITIKPNLCPLHYDGFSQEEEEDFADREKARVSGAGI